MNNVGTNGNYWSSTPNNENNAYNMNFNDNNVNNNGNNNRNNGQSVRLVQDFTKEQDLLTDLFAAYYAARRNKRNTIAQLRFELDLETNLMELYQELMNRTYRPSPSICFIVHDPVQREVFASQFRDRVVHHLFYNYVSPIFERLFVYDSYSCRKGKGTQMGIKRLEHHIRSCTDNYRKKAYVLKLDISGYFMSIDRERLRQLVLDTLNRCWDKADCPLDKDLLVFLTNVILQKDPLEGCRMRGNAKDWDGLPDNKSLRKAKQGVGLPIGDLTSQLFSNLYLNQLDQYVKRKLRFRHYGRYVDDFYIVDESKARLQHAVEQIRDMLLTIGLVLHPKKIVLQPADCFIRYLGALTAPCRRFAIGRTTRKFRQKIGYYSGLCRKNPSKEVLLGILSSVNSYLGYMRHFKSCKMVRRFMSGQSLLDCFELKNDGKEVNTRLVVVDAVPY